MSTPSHPDQLDLCAPYQASTPDYRLFDWSVGQVCDGTSEALRSRTPVLCSHDYDHAVRMARDHCLLEGRSVWVVDFNDNFEVVFRVHPHEYTAQALGMRESGRERSVL